MDDLAALRTDVARANRILEASGLSNAFGHASARIPRSDTFVLPQRRSPGFADAATLITLDFDGKVVAGEGTPNSEFWIHARIYAARPEIGAVVHAHPEACVCLTQIGEPHRVVHNQGGPFYGRVSEYAEVGLIRSRVLGDRLAASLGGNVAAMMRGLGITTVGSVVLTATVAALFLEESASLQLRMLAAAGGNASKIRAFTEEEAHRLDDQLGDGIVSRAWEYYAALADG